MWLRTSVDESCHAWTGDGSTVAYHQHSFQNSIQICSGTSGFSSCVAALIVLQEQCPEASIIKPKLVQETESREIRVLRIPSLPDSPHMHTTMPRERIIVSSFWSLALCWSLFKALTHYRIDQTYSGQGKVAMLVRPLAATEWKQGLHPDWK
jgi:hypothetical protein